ncbi:hypothetical protein ACOZ4L_02750 [Haloplanus ruber]|uniref:PGF-pre-PGF domain-containing protein n=1 Tax=Haloplanus ruber TaxID=869892 RepID=A0ABD6D3A6_9EURY|nr:hypothetical protein [Haloplanus ruber]
MTFTGRVSLTGTPSDGTQYQYSIQDGAAVEDFSVNITGVTNTEWDNVSATGLSDRDTLSTDVAGTISPSGPEGEPAVTFTGRKTIENDSVTGVANTTAGTIDLPVTGNREPINESVSLSVPKHQQNYNPNPIAVYGSDYAGDDHETLYYSNAPRKVSRLEVYWTESIESGAYIDVSVEGTKIGEISSSGWTTMTTSDPIPVSGDMKLYFKARSYSSSLNTGIQGDNYGDVGDNFKVYRTEDAASPPSTVSVTTDTETIDKSVSEGSSMTLSPNITTGDMTITTDSGVASYSIEYDDVTQTEDPSVSFGSTAGVSGFLSDGETVTKSVSSLSTSDDTLTVSTAGNSSVDVKVAVQERTRTDSPKLEVNGNTVGTDLTLADGETRTYTIQNEWITTGTNQINVSMDGSVSADAPDLVYELDYAHSATKRQEIDYSGGTFESNFNASTTYADDTTDAKVTFPFTGSVVGMESVEYRLNSGSWTAVSAENYRVRDNTTLVAYLSDASGGSLSAGDTIEVRATARKIEVANGNVSVVDVTKPGGELDTQLKVNSRSKGFYVNVGPTESGRRVHYAYSSVYPTADYAVIEADGDQQLHLPEAKTGDTLRVRHLETKVSAEQGDVRIDVVSPGENPELKVRPGPGGSGDPVTVEYYNTRTGVEYLLNSLTRSIVLDSDTAQSPAVFEDDDSKETWAILEDSGGSSSSSSGGGGAGAAVGQFADDAGGFLGSISLPIPSFQGLGGVALIGGVLVGGIVLVRRLDIFGGSADDEAAAAKETANDAGRSLARSARRSGVASSARSGRCSTTWVKSWVWCSGIDAPRSRPASSA